MVAARRVVVDQCMHAAQISLLHERIFESDRGSQSGWRRKTGTSSSNQSSMADAAQQFVAFTGASAAEAGMFIEMYVQDCHLFVDCGRGVVWVVSCD